MFQAGVHRALTGSYPTTHFRVPWNALQAETYSTGEAFLVRLPSSVSRPCQPVVESENPALVAIGYRVLVVSLN